DDCHVFARPDQIEGEINLMLDMIELTYKAFGFDDFWVRISVSDPENPEKYIGDKQVWIDSEASLKSLIQTRGWRHEVGVGEAAFYGPKLDFMFKDAIGREWQLSTIQLDMNLPNRFELEYTDSDGSKKRPVVIHRAILGSTERFLGILIEHYAGAFPFWLAPVQLRLATVSDEFLPFAQKLRAELVDAGIRVELDDSNEKVGKKIRDAATKKIPWTVVIGAKEAQGGDFKVNVFGQEEDLIVPATELVTRAKQASQFPQ
ncbi:MAG: His/Gly/Thr/Pro-type tRNA ligase C-terminal domain-containing protein, partial [Candidatus Uhrbacteria bacterium]|nr:His/Gly/Thr/Pro-type tRNA ligase C-terminal domain-containing protein [Candidatus Uhrbacteria bacterium]